LSEEAIPRVLAGTIFSACIELAEHVLVGGNEHSVSRVVKRYLDGKEFVYYYVSSKIVVKILGEILRRLKEVSSAWSYRYSITLGKNGLSLRIRNGYPSDKWYRLGLALGDASLLSKNSLIFTTSSPETFMAVVDAFDNARVYFARIMKNPSGELRCVFNIVVQDTELASEFLRIKGGDIAPLVKELKTNSRKLASFLAGVIDSDGIIDKDGVRVSLQRTDPLYRIVTELFERFSYDEKRFTLRLSTEELRMTNVLNALVGKVKVSHKSKLLARLLSKRSRHDYRQLVITDELVNSVIIRLGSDDLAIIRRLAMRKRGRYTYLYISASGSRQYEMFNELVELLRKISDVIGVDITGSVRLGNREVVIYSQRVVSLLMRIKEGLVRR